MKVYLVKNKRSATILGVFTSEQLALDSIAISLVNFNARDQALIRKATEIITMDLLDKATLI